MGKIKDLKDSPEVIINPPSENDIIDDYRISLTERIVRNIAHEIRNPLTNVMLGLEQLKNEFPTENEASEVYFSIIKRNCERINDLITNLVNAAKPSELLKNPQSINHLLEEVIQISKEKIEKSNIVLKKQFEEALPNANVDPDKIKEVFKNILDNAFRAMDGKKGELELKTQYLDDQFIIISIKDNGIGILPEDLKKIFDPFFRVKSSGTGLGLTLAQNIITNHKGNIKAVSNPNDGTTFTITLKI
ncbi:MAG: hypothetical protein H0X62_01930 [Bacteroidetes bacterium]|nr:hypothetical protein [Bacteroidota bacterium]